MEYYIYWDSDYNGSDRDELLEIVKSEEEKEKFVDVEETAKAYAETFLSGIDYDKDCIISRGE